MSKRLIVLLALFPIFLALRPIGDLPQQQPSESNTPLSFKAYFLYIFATNTDWPDAMKKGNFVIGVLGSPDLYDELVAKYAAKHVGSQPLQIVELATIPESQRIHILYIDKSRKADLPTAIKTLKDKSTLIVSHFDGGLQQGAGINFKAVNSNIRYELNRKLVEEKKISIGSKILQWAVN